MLNSFLLLVPPMLLGAQFVLTLVLVKGEICPGQRGRLHKILPATGVLWLASSTLGVEALGVAAPIFYFYSQVQTKKTRKKGPLWVLYLGNLFALAFVGSQLMELNSLPAQLAGVCITLLLGAVFAQLNMKLARSRLDAFHKLLPLTGVLVSILLVVLLSLQTFYFDEAALQTLSINIFVGIAFLIAGIIVWCWHLLRSSEAEKLQLSIALTLVMIACISFQPLFLL